VSQYTLLISDAVSQHFPTDALVHAFPSDDYRLIALPGEHLVDAAAEQMPDAIIAPPAPATERLFDTLAHRNTLHRPLRVLLPAPDQTMTLRLKSADAALAGEVESWSAQLMPLLKLRARVMALEADNARLSAEVGRLQSTPEEGALANVDNMKTIIGNIVGHELKTPLLQIKTAIKVLSEDPGNATASDLAVKATARLEEVVQRISIATQSMHLQLDAAVLRESVDFAVRSIKNSWRFREKVGRVQVELAANLPLVLADKRALGTALQQLIENALKYSEAPVFVTAARDGDGVRVTVRDTGIGIAKEQQAAIFDLFVQGDSSSTRRHDGAGIGLYLAKMIIERHHSRIHVESAPGKGSSFWFTLAVVDLQRLS
jgi:signal transduction histidine kinase